MQGVLTAVLAGGKGTRLEPLTRDRAKPAVPFGGAYRIIDFTLSNCINSGLRRIFVLTQYKAASLDRHLRHGWSFLSLSLDEFIEVIPPQQRIHEYWYQGTADAITQNIYLFEAEKPELVLILSGDHIYRMDYRQMLREHRESGAAVTIGCLPVPRLSATRFGVMQIDERQRVIGFQEKPADPTPIPGQPEVALASMGIYVFNAPTLFEQLVADDARVNSRHDFGHNILPHMIEQGEHVHAYLFYEEGTKQPAYWRDVGTLDDFYTANMDLVQVTPELNLYDANWPIRTAMYPDPPPKFVFSDNGGGGSVPVRRGEALDSLVCGGTIISGGHVRGSILSRSVRINSYAQIETSILFEGVQVGRNCRIRRTILDKYIDVPPNTEIGYDLEADRRRGFTVTESGLVVLPRYERIPSPPLTVPIAPTYAALLKNDANSINENSNGNGQP